MTAYAFFLRQTTDRPLVEVGRGIYGGDVCVLEERLADDIHSEPFAVHHICSCVFEATWAEDIACKGDDWWVTGDLLGRLLYTVLRDVFSNAAHHVEPTIGRA